MANEVTFSPNGYSFAGGENLLASTLVDVVNTDLQKSGLQEDLTNLGFVRVPAISPDQVVTGISGPTAMGEISENNPTPLKARNETYRKNMKIRQYGARTEVSKLLWHWIANKKTLQDADPSVKSALNDLRDSAKFLVDSAKMTVNQLATKVYSSGSVATASDGAGSPSPDGKALFAADHIIKNTGGSYSNALSTAFSGANLLAAIDAYRLNVRDHDGLRIKEPEAYTLIIPRDLKSTVYAALNAVNMQFNPSNFSGTGNNANQVNPFWIGTQRVDVVVADWLNQTDYTGATAGSATNWFLLNKDYSMATKALRYTYLFENEIDTWYDPDTRKYFVQLALGVSVDHFDPAAVLRGNA